MGGYIMIKAKTEMPIEAIKRAYEYNAKRKNTSYNLFYMISGIFIIFGLAPVYTRPHDWVYSDCWLIIPGIAILFLPLLINKITISNLKKIPALNTTLEWEIDENGVNGKGQGFSLSAKWDFFYETHITDKGILLYPQQQFFHWIPKDGFESNADYLKVLEFAKGKSKNITYSKDTKPNH
jgi:hypothetical protein